jgi:hypothetical protein
MSRILKKIIEKNPELVPWQQATDDLTSSVKSSSAARRASDLHRLDS